MSLELEDQYDKIYRYCYFKVQNREIAEDLTQEAFLKYFGQAIDLSKGKPLAYLYTIARNLCIDYFRKIKPQPLDEELAESDRICVIETSLVLRAAVRKLPDELQEMLLFRFSNELAIGEIAHIYGISRFAVRRKINTALDKLRIDIKEEDFNE